MWMSPHIPITDVAYDLVTNYPDMARSKDQRNSPLISIAKKVDLHYSGTCYNFYQRFVYSYMPLETYRLSNLEIVEDIENQVTNKANVVGSRRCFHPAVTQWIYATIWKMALLIVPHIKHLRKDKVKHNKARTLLRRICKEVSELNRENDLSSQYLNATIQATLNDNSEAIEEITESFSQAIWAKFNDYNIIQLAIIYRCEKVYSLLVQRMSDSINFLHATDTDKNNLLHLAGRLPPTYKLNVVSGAALQMQRELQWFKEVQKFVLHEQTEERNNNGETPIMVFREEHKALRKEGEEWMKKTADSYTITAALIITIVFAAAITVPGGNDGDTGKVIYSKKPSFITFAISDAISLFTSATSLVLSLSVLTSRYAEEDFLRGLPRRLIFGLVMLFLSLTSMMVAFSASLYIMFGQEREWILIPIAVLTCLPIVAFMTLQFPLLVELISSTYGHRIFGKQRDHGMFPAYNHRDFG